MYVANSVDRTEVVKNGHSRSADFIGGSLGRDFAGLGETTATKAAFDFYRGDTVEKCTGGRSVFPDEPNLRINFNFFELE